MASRSLALLLLVPLLGACAVSRHESAADHRLAVVTAAARAALKSQGASLTGASFTVPGDNAIDAETARACHTTHLIHVELIGAFPHTVVSPPPVVPGAPPRDDTVHALELDVDADTGRTCQQGVRTGDVAPQAGSVSIDLATLGHGA